MEDLKRAFYPKSVAIVGASAEPGKIGHQLLKNVIDHGYQGEIYPVNPRAKEILGLKCYPSLKEIPGDVDVVAIALPSKLVPRIVEEARERSEVSCNLRRGLC